MSDRRKDVAFIPLNDRHAILVEVAYPAWKGVVWSGYTLHGRLVEHIPPRSDSAPENGRLVVDVCDSRLPSVYVTLKEASRFSRKTLEQLVESAPETAEYAELVNKLTARYHRMVRAVTTNKED
jgi:hypothetical protein